MELHSSELRPDWGFLIYMTHIYKTINTFLNNIYSTMMVGVQALEHAEDLMSHKHGN